MKVAVERPSTIRQYQASNARKRTKRPSSMRSTNVRNGRKRTNIPCSCARDLRARVERGRHKSVRLQECGRVHLFDGGSRLEYFAHRCRGGVLDGDDRAEAGLRLLVEHVDQLEPSKGQGDREQHEESADHRVVLQDVPGRARAL